MSAVRRTEAQTQSAVRVTKVVSAIEDGMGKAFREDTTYLEVLAALARVTQTWTSHALSEEHETLT